MIGPVSQRTYARIRDLSRTDTVAGVEVHWCPCRVLPETVLNLKGIVREIERLWEETLGAATWEQLRASDVGAEFFEGRVRLVEVQEGRPEMVAVWLAVPPDFPTRLKVQLVDAVEPFPLP